MIVNQLRTIAVILSILFFMACEEPTQDLPVITREQIGVEKGKEVEIIYSDSAKIKVRVTGPTMLYHTDRSAPRQEFPEGTVTYFYDENQLEMSKLTGKYAVRDEGRKRVTIRDSVVWESPTDGRLETSELIWDEMTNIISSTKFTKITRKDETIYGFNFQTDDNLTHWRILSPKGSFRADDLKQKVE
jgi:LPS export ABC transporter protein LptC